MIAPVCSLTTPEEQALVLEGLKQTAIGVTVKAIEYLYALEVTRCLFTSRKAPSLLEWVMDARFAKMMEPYTIEVTKTVIANSLNR